MQDLFADLLQSIRIAACEIGALIKRRHMFLILTCLMMISICCAVAIAPDDNGRMEVDGFELQPVVTSWEVIIRCGTENEATIVGAIEEANLWFPYDVFHVAVDCELWSSLDFGPLSDRIGYVLLSAGSIPIPRDTFEVMRDPGGVTVLSIGASGAILTADVIINSSITYDKQTLRDVVLHELGHTLGFAHDDYSLDLRSCMSCPPAYDCGYTNKDIRLATNR